MFKKFKTSGGCYNYNGDVLPISFNIELDSGDKLEITWYDCESPNIVIWNYLEEDFRKWYWLNIFWKYKKEIIRLAWVSGTTTSELLLFFKDFIEQYFKEYKEILYKKYNILQ